MIVKTGNMWSVYKESELFLITTNSFIKKDGRLTMGAGIAKQAKDRFKAVNLDMAFGMAIEDNCGHLGKYGLIVSDFWPISKLGMFQTKQHWKTPSDLSLIAYSTEKLINFCEKNKFPRVDLNYPGIGYGGLKESSVFQIIRDLPDCVNVWNDK